MLTASGLASRLLELTARMLDQFDEQLHEAWEPFLIEDDAPAPAGLGS